MSFDELRNQYPNESDMVMVYVSFPLNNNVSLWLQLCNIQAAAVENLRISNYDRLSHFFVPGVDLDTGCMSMISYTHNIRYLRAVARGTGTRNPFLAKNSRRIKWAT